jgi:hypothetical protein
MDVLELYRPELAKENEKYGSFKEDPMVILSSGLFRPEVF